MRYFLDNTFPRQFAASLRPFDLDIVHLQEVQDFKLGAETKDEEWIPYVGERGWITLTADRRIAAAQRQRELLVASKLTTFFMPKAYPSLRLWTQFQGLVKAWEHIAANAERARPGDCFDVQENGKVTIMVLKR